MELNLNGSRAIMQCSKAKSRTQTSDMREQKVQFISEQVVLLNAQPRNRLRILIEASRSCGEAEEIAARSLLQGSLIIAAAAALEKPKTQKKPP